MPTRFDALVDEIRNHLPTIQKVEDNEAVVKLVFDNGREQVVSMHFREALGETWIDLLSSAGVSASLQPLELLAFNAAIELGALARIGSEYVVRQVLSATRTDAESCAFYIRHLGGRADSIEQGWNVEDLH